MTDTGVEAETRSDLIEKRIDRGLAGDILVSREAGGVSIAKLGEAMEAAKLMAISGCMVPTFMREQPGVCFGIVWKALHWGMDPFAVASMAYEVENGRTKERTVAFMSQLIHAVVEARAPIKGRLKVRYEGEGDDRICIVGGVFHGETEPREHRSPKLGDRRPKTQVKQGKFGEYETTPGSPLWHTKPDVQLYYDTSRDWARIYCPDVLLGVYTKEEMEDAGFTETPVPAAVPPPDNGLHQRLSASAIRGAGFAIETVVETLKEGNGDTGPLKPEGE